MKNNSSLPVHGLVTKALEHHRAGHFAEAEQIYRQILTLDPRHADCLHLLGMIAYQQGRLDFAEEMIRKAIAIHNGGASYYANLGTVVHSQGKLDEAEALYRRALALKPQSAEVHVNLANVLQAQRRLEESVLSYEQALALKPDSAEALNNLGNARQEQGLIDEALACYERALAVKPDYAEVYYNLGNAHRFLGKLDEAVEFYLRELAIAPEYPEAHYNLGNVLREQGKPHEALMRFEKALAFRPDYAQAGFGQALTQLLLGDFAAGWPNFERRWQTADHDTPRRAYAQPLWKGEKLKSGSVLIWGEQGIGDEIMFAGIVPDAIRTGNPCILDCETRLKPLFARSFPSVQVLSGCLPEAATELEIAAQLPSGSLPGMFRKDIAAFSATTSPYLITDRSKCEELRARYGTGKRLVGLAWYTNNCKTGRSRSIDLTMLAPLFAESGIQWISLQYGDHDALESQARDVNAPILIDRAIDQFKDMDRFAAQIAAMDLVITIDNSTAHLAGALGVPVWVLLPFAADWRWLLDREGSPWYPTMRLFRQSRLSDWDSVVETIKRALLQT